MRIFGFLWSLSFVAFQVGYAEESAEEQWERGAQYFLGQDVPQDYGEAVRWFRKAAERGLARGQYSLGICYRDGTGVEKDPEQAWRWFRKAGDQGDGEALYQLGVMAVGAFSFDQRPGMEALAWYRKAVERGHVAAHVNLALYYYYGMVVDADKEKAVALLTYAAEQGSEAARYNLQVIDRVAAAENWCFACGGSGIQEVMHRVGPGNHDIDTIDITCSQCNGEGLRR